MKTTCSWTLRNGKRPRLRELEALTLSAAECAGISEDAVLSVVFLNAARMEKLNGDALGHTGPTDVISFDLRPAPGAFFPAETEVAEEAGVEIYVCPDVAEREARKRNLSVAREIVLYIVHGFLHVAGEDDLSPEKKRKMRRAEKRVLGALEKQYDFERIFRLEKTDPPGTL